jgi:hypothetical protein
MRRSGGASSWPLRRCWLPCPDPKSWKLFDGAADNLDNRRGIIDLLIGSRLSKTRIDHISRYSDESSDRTAFATYLQAWAKTDFTPKSQVIPLPGRQRSGSGRRGDESDLPHLVFESRAGDNE